MAIAGLDRRASKLEDSLEHVKRQKEQEERKASRWENSDRLRWEMFLRCFGPGENFNWARPDLEKPERGEEANAEAEAALLLEEALKRVLAHADRDGNLDYKSMDSSDKAVANLFDTLFMVIEDEYLFKSDLEHWEHTLGLDLPSFVDLVKAIDAHFGSSDWRQICCLEESQERLLKAIYEKHEADRTRALKYRERKALEEKLAQTQGA